MVCSLSVLGVVISLASSVPLNNREDIVEIIQSQNNLDNTIDVDERPNKQVEPSYLLTLASFVVWLAMAWFNDCLPFKVEIDIQSLDSVPLGSQFAAEIFFPERRKLETGHR